MSVSDANSGKGENESLSWIISFLKLRPGELQKAERILRAREERLMSEKVAMEVELQKVLEEWRDMRENVVNVERKLEICQIRCSQLELEIEKNKDLELAKRRADVEIELWKKKYSDLESRVWQLEKETLAFTSFEQELFREVEPRNENGTEGHLSQFPLREKSSSNLETQTPGQVDSTSQSSGKVDSTSQSSGKVDSTSQSSSPLKGFSSSGVAEDQTSAKTSNKLSVSAKEKTKSISSVSNMRFQTACSNKKHSTSARPKLKDIIDICESDGEIETISCKSRGDNNVAHSPLDNFVEETVDDEQEMTSKKRLKRTSFDVKVEENWICHDDTFPLAGPRRKTASKIVTCDDGSDEDQIPIGKLRMEKIEKLGNSLKPKDSEVNNSFLAPLVSLEDEDVKETTMLKQKMSSLKQCKDKLHSVERTSVGQLENTGTLHESGIPDLRDAKESNWKMDGLVSVFDGLCNSDDSESEDSSSNSVDTLNKDTAIHRVFSDIIRTRKHEKLKWLHESDMLSSFEVDPELCMMAVCALHRQNANNQGFSNIDKLRGGMLAKFLMDGNQEGDVKKSVKELNMYDPKGLEDCKRLAIHYSTQLFRIYQSRKDPFFLSLNSQLD